MIYASSNSRLCPTKGKTAFPTSAVITTGITLPYCIDPTCPSHQSFSFSLYHTPSQSLVVRSISRPFQRHPWLKSADPYLIRTCTWRDLVCWSFSPSSDQEVHHGPFRLIRQSWTLARKDSHIERSTASATQRFRLPLFSLPLPDNISFEAQGWWHMTHHHHRDRSPDCRDKVHVNKKPPRIMSRLLWVLPKVEEVQRHPLTWMRIPPFFHPSDFRMSVDPRIKIFLQVY